jgi:DNA polymerase III subunit delta
MEFEQIMTDLQNKKYKPVYFLMGEESYYIDEVSDYIAANVLSEADKSFNQTVMYGKDIEVARIIDACRRYPMMAPYQVIIVKEAQNVKNIDDLLVYVEKPLKSTILVVNFKYGKLDKRKKLSGAIEKNGGVLLTSEKLYENKIPAWITAYLTKHGFGISPEGAALLTEFLGADLSKIVNELGKLMITMPEGLKKITPDMIEKNIGISKDFNNFELQKAVATRDILKANRIIDYFEKNPKENPMLVTVSSLFSYFQKLLTYHFIPDKSRANVAVVLKVNPYFVAEYETAAKKFNPAKVVECIALLREFDLKSKGVGGGSATHGELLKELVFRMMH